jgi:hypothetical protein
MPHVPELQAHDTHDLELVAAFAGRALDGRALEEATVLVARCTACAELHADLRAISAAVPALPVPPRRRDYRLTQEQAAALRPSGWRRILAAFASPRFSFAAPLGTGLATLGLAGLLLAAMPGAIPSGAFEPAIDMFSGEGRSTGEQGGAPEPAAGAPEPAAGPPDKDGQPPLSQPGLNSSGGATSGEGALDPDTTGAQDDAAVQRARSMDELLVVVGGAALLTGLGLAGLRWSARRFV